MKNIIGLFICFLLINSWIGNAQKNKDIKIKKVSKAVLYAGSLERIENFPSKNIQPRNVDIWLPKNYRPTKKYAVLYMHDGQNLFDATTTWNKQEWKVDDWVSKLIKEQKIEEVIVVGIHNIPALRWQDLFPEKAMSYMPKQTRDSIYKQAKATNFNVNLTGDNYLKFLVEELKPFIDANYSVYTDKDHTFVMGSSMGGLMSMYAISEYPTVFGGAACLSTHWVGAIPTDNNPFPDAIFEYMDENLPTSNTHKIYFDYGNKTLDEHYPKYAPRVNEILKRKGYTDKNSKNLFFEGADHSENSWNKRLNIPLQFLLHK